MKQQSRPVIILAGQMFYDQEKDDYLIVTKHQGDLTRYAGYGFRGQLETEMFLDRFQPVDPADVPADELQIYLQFCPPETSAKVGFIKD